MQALCGSSGFDLDLCIVVYEHNVDVRERYQVSGVQAASLYLFAV